MKCTPLLSALLLSAALTLPASAYDMTISGADQGGFARPTSDTTIYITESPNQNLSKDTAVVPPDLGYTVSPTVGSALNPFYGVGHLGGLGNLVTAPSTSFAPTTNPSVSGAPAYTAVTSDLYYTAGNLGTLSIPSIGLSVKVYQGTDSGTLAKGAGHFTSTSVWDGNVAIAGHNRGVNNYFGKIHTLSVGDTISYSTKLGVKTYAVTSVRMTSMLSSTSDDQITLITCVMNQREYRWCVTAVGV